MFGHSVLNVHKLLVAPLLLQTPDISVLIKDLIYPYFWPDYVQYMCNSGDHWSQIINLHVHVYIHVLYSCICIILEVRILKLNDIEIKFSLMQSKLILLKRFPSLSSQLCSKITTPTQWLLMIATPIQWLLMIATPIQWLPYSSKYSRLTNSVIQILFWMCDHMLECVQTVISSKSRKKILTKI